MATLSVVSCKYDGEHVITKLKVEVLDIKNTVKEKGLIRSNQLSIFSPHANTSFNYQVDFYRDRSDRPIRGTYNDDKFICCVPESTPKDYTYKFDVKEKVLKMDAVTRNVLADDLRQYSQFTIDCKPKTFTVNKAILQARSPVFCAMISNNFKEGQENRVEINDFEPEIVEKMIEFCETDEIKETSGHELELYKIARKYQIESFMVYTRETLIFTTTFDNSCEYLKLSKMYSDDKLTDFLLLCIRPNIQHIRKTPGFFELTDEEIVGIFR